MYNQSIDPAWGPCQITAVYDDGDLQVKYLRWKDEAEATVRPNELRDLVSEVDICEALDKIRLKDRVPRKAPRASNDKRCSLSYQHVISEMPELDEEIAGSLDWGGSMYEGSIIPTGLFTVGEIKNRHMRVHVAESPIGGKCS